MNLERSSFGAVVHKTRLFVFGGLSADSAEYYEMCINKWILVSKFNSTTTPIQNVLIFLILTTFSD